MTDTEKLTKTAERLLRDDKIVHVENNETYDTMVDFIKRNCEGITEIELETYEITSMVQGKKKKDLKCYSGECLNIVLPSGSHLRLKPYGNDVDLSRIISKKQGDGTFLMTLVVAAYLYAFENEGCKGRFILECLGAVGMGVNYNQMDIPKQAAFFRKFGFRVFGKYNPKHIHMDFRTELKDECVSRIKRFWPE